MAWVQDTFGLIGQTLDGKFRVERAVAEGGFAIVYAGTHVSLRRPIAIKVLRRPPQLTQAQYEGFIENFASEARTIARLSHPNIVQVLDFGVSPMPNGERSPWMVMEWLEGRTLREKMVEQSRRGGFSATEAYAYVRPLLEALAYAHDEGIAHRDIKPANVMLVQSRRGTTVKLLDFGIAKVMEDDDPATQNTRTHAALQAFSLNYATPEQLGQTRSGPWTDVHAIALVMSELLTGRQAFGGRDRAEIMRRILLPQRPTPASFGIDVGPIEPVLARALALRPVDRFANAGELLSALDGAISSFPTELRGLAQRAPAPPITSTGAFGAAGSDAENVPTITGAVPLSTSEMQVEPQAPVTITALSGSRELPVMTVGHTAARTWLAMGAAVMVLCFTAAGFLLRIRMTRDAGRAATMVQAVDPRPSGGSARASAALAALDPVASAAQAVAAPSAAPEPSSPTATPSATGGAVVSARATAATANGVASPRPTAARPPVVRVPPRCAPRCAAPPRRPPTDLPID